MLNQEQVLTGMDVASEIVDKILTHDGDRLRSHYQAKFIKSQIDNALDKYFAYKEEQRALTRKLAEATAEEMNRGENRPERVCAHE